MTCAPTDIACGVAQAVAPALFAVMAIIVLLFLGAFGGKVGKVLAIVGIFFLLLWYFGVPGLLEPLKKYAGMTVFLVTVQRLR